MNIASDTYAASAPFAHGGRRRALAEEAGVSEENILDFSASINPLGFPEWLRPLVSNSLSDVAHYPDPHAAEFVQAVAQKTGLDKESIVPGNGSTELFRALARVSRRSRAIVTAPSYRDYEDAARLADMDIAYIPLDESTGFVLEEGRLDASIEGDELIFLGHPNNPTGMMLDPSMIERCAATHPDALFCIDEAFLDFCDCDGESGGIRALTHSNIVVISSLTKIFALPGLRIGWLFAEESLAGRVRNEIPPWSMNTLAQKAGTAAMSDRGWIDRTREFTAQRRAELLDALLEIKGLTVFPSHANFLLCRIDSDAPRRAGPRLLDANDLRLRLLRDEESPRRIAIRSCSNFTGLDHRFFRVAVRTREENELLVDALSRQLEIGMSAPTARPQRNFSLRPPALMIQGTSSNAGKSLVTAALCRILLQDGLRVAPFKSQNMSLNSFVTRDGGEMGRAQVVQAQACRLDPDVRMNPILLKPTGATGSQVIVMGKPVGSMSVDSYIAYKRRAFATVVKAYDELAAKSDVMVLEGAGSPGEVNLKSHDIANMAMAFHAGAHVLLVGDIDRGGVFASFIGTMEVLNEAERETVKGFIVNKFRGQADLLQDAFAYMKSHTNRDVLGVIPWLDGLNIPEEDSVGYKSGAFDLYQGAEACVDIALIDLPHFSNHSDFDPFRVESDVTLRVVRSAAELGTPDVIMIPGSRNVAEDLACLRSRGLADAILAARELRCEVVGICAGMQMLGRELRDPHALESSAPVVAGLAMLDLTTTLEQEKTLKRVRAHHANGVELFGYEIHHGQTVSGEIPCIMAGEGTTAIPLGYSSADELVWGTYLHGAFDSDVFRRSFIDRVRTRKGLAPRGTVTTYDIEPALDRLADAVRKSIRLDEIRRMLKI